MADFSATYNALRRLAAGHVLNQSYTFDVDLRVLDVEDNYNGRQILTPTDAETDLISEGSIYFVETRWMDEATMLLCREFLNSCNASEKFTVVLEGAAPADAHLISQRRIKPTRLGLKYRYKFKIRVY